MLDNPNYKRALAEAEITAAAVRLGVPVFKPVSEHGRADLVFEIGGRLWRVQCKWAGLDREGAVVRVNTTSAWHTASGTCVRTRYSVDDVDLLAVYCGELDCCFLLSDLSG